MPIQYLFAIIFAQSDLLTVEQVRAFPADTPLGAVFHPNREAAVVLEPHRLVFHDFKDNTTFARNFRTRAEATIMAGDRAPQRLAIGFADGSIELWDWTGDPGPTANPHKKAIRALAFAPSGTILASGSDDHSVAVLSAANLAPTGSPATDGKQNIVFTGFTRNGLSLVAIGAGGTVQEWDANTWRELRRFNLSENNIFSGAIDGAGTMLAIGGQFARLNKGSPMRPAHPSDFFRDNRIAIYDLSSWREAKRIESLDGEIHGLEFSPDARYLVAVKRKVRGTQTAIIDAGRGVTILDLPAADRTRLATFHPRGKHLVAAGSQGGMLYRVAGISLGTSPGNLAGSKLRILSSDTSPLLRGRKNEVTAVMDLDAALLDRAIGQAFAESLRSRIVNSGQKLVTLDRMKEIIRQQNFQQSDRTDQSTAVALGRLLNARHIVYGTIAALATTYTVTLHLVDVETAQSLGIREALCQRCSLEDLPALAAELETVLVEPKP